MKSINLNREWYFKFGENAGDEKGGSFASYSPIGLPHSFGIPYYGENSFYIGYGCYRKKLTVAKEWLEQKIILEFGAVFQVAKLYVNGVYAGCHQGGYTAFTFDITDYVQEGENHIFVRVNNLWNPVIAPRAGEHLFNGGIYRDVKLLLYPKSHIAWYGTFVKTAQLDDETYEITVETETVDCNGLLLSSRILDQQGNCVKEAASTVQESVTVQKIILKKPVLWDIDNPYLYRLYSACGEDFLVTEFGVRTIRWEKENGFFLNGRRVLLEGANVHQDHGGWGDAVTHAGIRRDVKIVRECGFNFIRGSHYPHHTEFAKECDRQGILFWSEGVFWGIGGFGRDGYWDSSAMPVEKRHYADFEASLKQTLREMIRTNRNSPSIIVWSMGNEMFFSDNSVLQDARQLCARLVEYSHQLDDTRPAGLGGVQRGDFDGIGDVAGYNGDGAVLFKNPPKPSMVAEYGSMQGYRPGRYDLYETPGSDEYYPWRAGRSIWCAFHHGSIADIGDLGIVDLYRLPLNAWYCHREKLRGIKPPLQAVEGIAHHIRLRTDKTEIQTDGTDDCMLIAELFDKENRRVNTETEISIEIVSGPGVLPAGNRMTFSKSNKSCFDGACAIEMRAYYAGEIRVRAVAEGMISDELVIIALGDEDSRQQKILYPLAPKQDRKSASKRKDILKDRPVMVSSEAVAGNRMAVNGNSEHPYWMPEKEDTHPYLLFDMEHCYSRFDVELRKNGSDTAALRILVSLDKEEWLEAGQDSSCRKDIKFEVKTEHGVRYVKVETSREIKVEKISIYPETEG